MSSFIVFIIIAIAWAVFGSLKAAADKVGNPSRSNPYQMKTEPDFKAPTPVKPMERIRVNHREETRSHRGVLKREDLLPDFGDKSEGDKRQSTTVRNSTISQEPTKKSDPLEVASLFKGNRLRESIILAECLDRPRAYRPHPLNKQHNLLERRG